MSKESRIAARLQRPSVAHGQMNTPSVILITDVMDITEVLLNRQFGFVMQCRVQYGRRLADITPNDIQIGL
jgi:hypothetical protein